MANRFWVGGTGTWDAVNTANWSATTGGAGGASVPTSADYVTINANSGGGTITLGLDVPCQGLDIRGFTGTLDFSNYVINTAGNSQTSPRQDNTATVTGTKTVNMNYAGATGTRTISMVGVTEANALNINVTAGTDTIATSALNIFKNFNFTGFAGTYTNTTRTIYGNLTISSGMTVTAGTSATTFAATSGTQQITTNGKTLDFPITQNSPGATLALQDNLTMSSTRTFTLTAGTLDLTGNSGNWTLSTGLFNSTNSNTRAIAFGTGKFVLTGGNTATAIWNMGTATGFTYTGTPRVEAAYTATSLGTRTISHGSTSGTEANAIDVYITSGTDTVAVITHIGNLDFTGFTGTFSNGTSSRRIYKDIKFVSGMTFTGGIAAISMFSASNTQNFTSAGLTIDAPVRFEGAANTTIFQDALTMGATREMRFTSGTAKLKAGATTTVGTFATTGMAQKFLQSTTPGSQATISQASGTVDVSYLTIQDSNATGGATWNAYVNQQNIDAGNNDGWDFGISPIVGSYEYTYQLRSFTQPRRF